MASTVVQVIQSGQQILSTLEQAAAIDRRFYSVFTQLATLNSTLESHQAKLTQMEREGIESEEMVNDAISRMQPLLQNCKKAAQKHLKRNAVSRFVNTGETGFICTRLEKEIGFQVQILQITCALEAGVEARRTNHILQHHIALSEQERLLEVVKREQTLVSVQVAESLSTSIGNEGLLTNVHPPISSSSLTPISRSQTLSNTRPTTSSSNRRNSPSPSSRILNRSQTAASPNSRLHPLQIPSYSPATGRMHSNSSPSTPTNIRASLFATSPSPPPPTISEENTVPPNGPMHSNSFPGMTTQYNRVGTAAPSRTTGSRSPSPVPPPQTTSQEQYQPEHHRSVSQPTLPSSIQHCFQSTSSSSITSPTSFDHPDQVKDIFTLEENKRLKALERYHTLKKKNSVKINVEDVGRSEPLRSVSQPTLSLSSNSSNDNLSQRYNPPSSPSVSEDPTIVLAEAKRLRALARHNATKINNNEELEEEVISGFEKSGKMFEILGELFWAGECYHDLGVVCNEIEGRKDQALKWFEKASTLFLHADCLVQHARCAYACGIIYAGSDRTKAIETFTNVALIFASLNDGHQEAGCYASCGNLLLDEDPERAIGYLSTAISIYEGLEEFGHQAKYRFLLAGLQEEKDTKSALQSYTEALKLFRKLRDDENVGNCCMACARLTNSEESLNDDYYYEYAAESYEKACKFLLQANALSLRAGVSETLESEWAITLYLQAQALYEKHGSWKLSADKLMRCKSLVGDEDKAKKIQWLDKAEHLYRQAGENESSLECAAERASLLQAGLDDVRRAVERYQRQSSTIKDDVEKARCNLECGKLLAPVHPERAASFYKTAAVQYRRAGKEDLYAQSQFKAAEIISMINKVDAADMLEELAETFADLGNLREEANCYGASAKLLMESSPSEAERLFGDAIALLKTFDDDSADQYSAFLASM